MGYDLHIERQGEIPLSEWMAAVASVPGIRLESSPVTVMNPKTGARITVPGQDGDVAVMLGDAWVKVFCFYEGRVTFRAGSISLNDPSNPVARAAQSLCRILGAKIVGDDGEEYPVTN